MNIKGRRFEYDKQTQFERKHPVFCDKEIRFLMTCNQRPIRKNKEINFSKLEFPKIDVSTVDFSTIDFTKFDFSNIDFFKIDMPNPEE